MFEKPQPPKDEKEELLPEELELGVREEKTGPLPEELELGIREEKEKKIKSEIIENQVNIIKEKLQSGKLISKQEAALLREAELTRDKKRIEEQTLPEEVELGMREEKEEIKAEEVQEEKTEEKIKIDQEKTQEERQQEQSKGQASTEEKGKKEKIRTQERPDTTHPDNSFFLLCSAGAIEVWKDIWREIKSIFREEKQEKRLPFFDRIIKTRADLEKLWDNGSKEYFINECRKYDEAIETAGPDDKKRLKEEMEAYKKKWKEAEKREKENRQIRDEGRETLRNIFKR